MELRELIRWGWANDRAACLIVLIFPAFMALVTLGLEIVK